MIDIIRIEIMQDYETPDRAGASESFQVCNINGYNDSDKQIDLSGFIDQGYFYKDKNEIVEDLKQKCREYDFTSCEIEFV